VAVETQAETFTFDFIIFATGAETDLSARSELAPMIDQIALWRDRFAPPPGEESDVLAKYPYLGPAFEFTEREPGTAPYLSRLHNFTYGATQSLGLTGAAIPGLKYGVPRLVNGLVGDLFREDAAGYYRDLLAYTVLELETLESEFAWLDKLGTEALENWSVIDGLDKVALAKTRKNKVTSKRPNDKPVGNLSKRIQVDHAAGPARAKGASTGRAERRPRAK
jgi:cation diffusion facilitator CzcD-associated flavoprotein CzcO